MGINMNKTMIHLCLCALIATTIFMPCFAYAAHDMIRFGSNVSVNEQQLVGEVVVFGGNITIDGHSDNVVAIGGNISTASSSTTENIIAIGGTVTVDGTVNGDIVVVGGTVTLLDNAVIKQDVILYTSALDKTDAATIQGNIVHKNRQDFSQVMKNDIYGLKHYLPDFFSGFWVWSSATSGLLLLAFGWLLGILFPNHTKSVAYTLNTETWRAFGIGLLIKILAIPVAIALAITILGIPLIFVLFFAIWLLQYFGLAALGYLIGDKLAKQLDKQLSFGIMMLIGLLIIALVNAVPIGGSLIYFVLKCLALGAVVLSRFGNQTNSI